jgi:hypothetical protein
MAARAAKTKATPTTEAGGRNTSDNPERIRLEAMAETIRAIRRLGSVASADLLSDYDDMRGLAAKLGVPVLFVALLDGETDAHGPVDADDINELAAWPHRDLVKVA